VKGKLVTHGVHEPVGDSVDAVACREINNQKRCNGDFKPIELCAGDIVIGGFLMLSQRDSFAQGFRHLIDRALEVYDLGQTRKAVY